MMKETRVPAFISHRQTFVEHFNIQCDCNIARHHTGLERYIKKAALTAP